MRVAIVGSRNYNNYAQVKLKDFKNLLQNELQTSCIPRFGKKGARNVYRGWRFMEDDENNDF